MPTEHLPWIEPANYGAFQKLITQLPHSYEAWKALHDELVAEQMMIGSEPAEVKVRPDMFERWCRDNGHQPTLNALLQFASEEGRPPEEGSHLNDGTANPWGTATNGKA